MRLECVRTVFSDTTSISAMRATVLPRAMSSMISVSRAERR